MRLVAIALAAACVATASPLAGPNSVISVSNVESLYKEVNNSANVGATIEVAPGRYTLTRLDPSGTPRPNGGRLELQADMSLVGVQGHSDAVVIDSSNPSTGPAFGIPPLGNAGTIRIGRGNDRVEWLTVVGGTASAGGVQTDLNGSAAPSVRIAHVISQGSVRGIDVRNLGPAATGRRLTVDLDRNEVFANTAGNGQGFRFVNSTDADGSSIVVSMRGNDSHDNNTGVLVANLSTNGASISIDAHGDRFENNAVGAIVFGGNIGMAATPVNGNSVTIAIHAGSIAGNNGVGLLGLTGGLNVVGGQAASLAGATSHNSVTISSWGTRFADNRDTDVKAWGAMTSAALPAGTSNVVRVELHGVSKKAVTSAIASTPAEPAGTNRATIVK